MCNLCSVIRNGSEKEYEKIFNDAKLLGFNYKKEMDYWKCWTNPHLFIFLSTAMMQHACNENIGLRSQEILERYCRTQATKDNFLVGTVYILLFCFFGMTVLMFLTKFDLL